MIIKKISLTNFRTYTQADFEFNEGMNLLVGVNGVGKTTVLEALRVCLSVIYPNITKTKHKKESFVDSDIKIGTDYLQVSCDFSYLKANYNLLIVKRKENYVVNNTDNIREQTISTPDQEVFTPNIRITAKIIGELTQDPISIIFSTKRSLITEKAPSKMAVQGSQIAAHADALNVDRYFNLRVFADWFKVQEILAEEQPNVLQYISTIRTAVEIFLPGFNNLHLVEIDGTSHFFIDKHGVPLNVYQLSDGERGVLAMVLDIAKRITQANPTLTNPLQTGKGVILIDELDLHLHPKWQRSIVENLTRTFPNCQFIATTHSPQIIGEVPPKNIIVIDNGTYNPLISFGVDSNRILSEILDTPQRTKKTNNLLIELYKALDKENIKESKKHLSELIKILGPDDPEITRTNTMINFLEDDLNNETNKKK